MVTEPTLGQRILDAAIAYAAAISEHVVALSRGTWEVARADAVTDAMDALRALAARAAAAERLAVARIRWNDMSTTNSPAALWDALIEVQGSEAAWRAINGEVG